MKSGVSKRLVLGSEVNPGSGREKWSGTEVTLTGSW
uniref:Uncharacterized protein n=1 Tax=Anguilla anguilla TaxID=7936 RepID=A0A0E9W4K4_ANGAN